MNTLDFLLDFIQALDDGETYSGFRVCHSGRAVELDSLGNAAYEHFSSITNTLLLETPVAWRFHRLSESVLIELELLLGEQDNVEVRVAGGGKTDELNISDMLVTLKEMHP